MITITRLTERVILESDAFEHRSLPQMLTWSASVPANTKSLKFLVSYKQPLNQHAPLRSVVNVSALIWYPQSRFPRISCQPCHRQLVALGRASSRNRGCALRPRASVCW